MTGLSTDEAREENNMWYLANKLKPLNVAVHA